MDSTLEALIEQISHSPQLVEVADRLQAQIRSERERRGKFYEEMTPEQKIEFIDGEVILHSPAKNQHLDVSKRTLVLLNTYVELHELGQVESEKCLCVFPRNDYEPDVVFFGTAKAKKLKPNTMKFPIPDLIVEVLSESTEKRDRGVKFEDFQAHGVGEYWVMDAERRVVEQYVLRDSTYDLTLKSSTGELRSEAIPGLVIPVRAFFYAEDNMRALRELMGK